MDGAFGGTNGANVGVGGLAAAANPAAMTDLGLTFDDITVGHAPAAGSLLGSIMSVMGSLFGVTPAQALGLYSPGGLLVGFINMPGTVAVSDIMTAMQITGGKIATSGAITNPTGLIGFINLGNLNHPGGLTTVQVGTFDMDMDTVTGPIDLDSPASSFDVTLNGQGATVGGYSPDVGAQITKLNGVPITRSLPTPLVPTGINSSVGIPLTDAKNITRMFSKQNSFVLPGMIGGLDGLYSLRTGKRVVPPANVGAAPKGFSVGQFANYAPTLLLLAGAASGYQVLLGAYGEPIQVIDPSTGHLFSPVSYAYVRVYNGSQQINLLPALSPGYAYTGPAPNAFNPGYNLANAVSPIVAVTNLTISNIAVTSPAAFAAQNPGYNYGGPEGPNG